MMTTWRGFVWIACVLSMALVGACREADAPRARAENVTRAQAATAASATKAPTADASAPIPATTADLFPPGPGREAVLSNCGSCHNLACATIGQRMAARWDALQESHRERVSDADLDATFAYLKATFNDRTPEPRVPPKFLQGGCTPF
jgi:mono/diheme cytochrome c family protein